MVDIKTGITDLVGNSFDLRVYVLDDADLIETCYEFMSGIFQLDIETSCFCKKGKRYRVFTNAKKNSFAIVRCDKETWSFVIFGGDDGTVEKFGFHPDLKRGEV